MCITTNMMMFDGTYANQQSPVLLKNVEPSSNSTQVYGMLILSIEFVWL